jgi:glycosyltransferase involved in cell wall biosynthesis
MLEALHAGVSKQELLSIINSAASYNGKLTDDKVEEKFQFIDWGREKIILFVGRLIASKGLHSVIAALPEILEAEPQARLIVVGHGPQREPLEALIRALQHGYKELVLHIVQWGWELEGTGEGPWEEMLLYFDQLQEANKLDDYFANAQRYLGDNTILFTGYLTHRELCHLFPACDVAVFPSVVAEAGPLVFLMASGCFPVGTYFAGMAASIDSVSDALPPEILDLMKLSPNAAQTVSDIISKVGRALYVDRSFKDILREVAIEKYDWQNISQKLASDLKQLQR